MKFKIMLLQILVIIEAMCLDRVYARDDEIERCGSDMVSTSSGSKKSARERMKNGLTIVSKTYESSSERIKAGLQVVSEKIPTDKIKGITKDSLSAVSKVYRTSKERLKDRFQAISRKFSKDKQIKDMPGYEE